jgi:hypothetical protein
MTALQASWPLMDDKLYSIMADPDTSTSANGEAGWERST